MTTDGGQQQLQHHTDLPGQGVRTDRHVYTDNVGGSSAHNNMPPYMSLNYIIKT